MTPLLRVTAPAQASAPTTCCAASTSTCAPGDRIAILGASGSGKSTLLRCLNFMEMPSAGAVELDGSMVGAERTRATASQIATASAN